MDTSNTAQLPVAAAPEALGPAASAPEPATYQQCDECGAAVDARQRYCVVCGAHRRHVDDPAARYLSQATARARSTRPVASAQRGRAPRARGLGVALALALIPAAAAAGVLAGRSSNDQDSALIRALAQRQSAAVTTAAAPAATAAAPAAATTTSRGIRRHGATARATATTSRAKNAGRAVSSTQYGSVTQITGAKPTQAQEQQGAQDTQQVQKSTGRNYINQQSNLPGTVVVP